MKIVEINKDYHSYFSFGIGSIRCSYEKLHYLFGEPKKEVGYKSDYEWTLNMDNGDHINIYDWKIGKNYLGEKDGLEKEEIWEWSVGSNNSNLISFLNELLESEEWGAFDDVRLKMFMSEKLINVSKKEL